MFMQLGAYLERLETLERNRPEEKRRRVPTMRELAEVAGISPVSLSRLTTGKVNSLNFHIGAAILDELNKRGFPAGPADILGYEAPEEADQVLA
jgi:DNA-binding Xre family transcriptional regulator